MKRGEALAGWLRNLNTLGLGFVHISTRFLSQPLPSGARVDLSPNEPSIQRGRAAVTERGLLTHLVRHPFAVANSVMQIARLPRKRAAHTMNRIPRLAVVAAVAMAILSGCAVPGAGPQKLGGSPPGSSHPGVAPVPGTEQGAISITLSSRGCAPRPSAVKVSSGYLTFTVTPTDREQNLGVQLRGPGGVLADQENLRSGQSGRFWLQLSPGSYTVRCPGARLSSWPFTVNGGHSTTWTSNPLLVRAVQQYRSYVRRQAASLVFATNGLVEAVKLGNLRRARLLYPQAHQYFERLEVVAKTWADLARVINGTFDDFGFPYQFTGFHKIEAALWWHDSLTGMNGVANELKRNVDHIAFLIQPTTYQPAEIADNAVILLTDLETLEITGEEEQYSLTDLIDIRANLDSASESFAVLTPALKRINPQLTKTIATRYGALYRALKRFESHPGYDRTGYNKYTNLYQAQGQQLARSIDPVAEAMSQVPGLVS